MVKLIKQNGQTSYGIIEYIVDTFVELNNLFDGNMGDTAYVIDEKQTYILNSEKQWIIKKVNSSSTGKDGLTPYINNSGTWQIGDTDTGVKAEGEPGPKGDAGYTPIKGIDYFTEEEKQEFKSYVDITVGDIQKMLSLMVGGI